MAADPEIEVIGTASDPFVAARRIQDEVPDVITLDVEMPRMDGITFLRKIMAQHPIPVVMCSTLTEDGSETLLQALEAGAVDVILKPRVDTHAVPARKRSMRICDVGEGRSAGAPAAHADAADDRSGSMLVAAEADRRCHHAAARRPARDGAHHRNGGLHRRLDRRHQSLRVVLEALPAAAPGIVIVQHMPEKFTAAFARRLDGLCQSRSRRPRTAIPCCAAAP